MLRTRQLGEALWCLLGWVASGSRCCRSEEIFEGVDTRFDGLGIAAAHENDNRYVVRAIVGKDALVALVEAFAREGQFAQGVCGEGVDACLIQNEVVVLWADLFEGALEAV